MMTCCTQLTSSIVALGGVANTIEAAFLMYQGTDATSKHLSGKRERERERMKMYSYWSNLPLADQVMDSWITWVKFHSSL